MVNPVLSATRIKQPSIAGPRETGKTLLGEGQIPPTSHPLPPISQEDLRFDSCLEYPYAAKGTIHLKTSMSSPRFELKPYGTVVRVANHYTGWVAKL
ncbi:hypothetical protein TNCV_3814931 [Trichonephila clavipes]|nr:hypothetical protein TNCV_3814931 [Trichonephila clavipes]